MPSRSRRARRARRAIPLAALPLALLSCGGPPAIMNGPLSGDGPILTTSNGNPRLIVVTHNAAQTQAGLAESCIVQPYLFDTNAIRDLNAIGQTSGECRLYSTSSDLALAMQNWICAGGLNFTYNGHSEAIGACPTAGHPPTTEGLFLAGTRIECAQFTPGSTMTLTSENELGAEDTVTDLSATLTLPQAVTITQPTNLGVTTWPAAGDVEVRWSSDNATSALVFVRPRDAASNTPIMVCQPHTNGRTTLPADLVLQGNFRTVDMIVTVASYADATAMAGTPPASFRVSAGFSSSVLLQARH